MLWGHGRPKKLFKIQKNEKIALFNVSHRPPRPYGTPKTRYKDGKSGLLPKKYGFDDERYSGKMTFKKFESVRKKKKIKKKTKKGHED